MQEKFDIALPGDLAISLDNDALRSTIEMLFKPGIQPYNLLLEALTEENRDKYGSSKFDAIAFEVKRFDPITFKGRIRVNYKLQLTFSCSAIVNDLHNQHSYWNFEIDPILKTAHFEGEEYGDLRSTSNEF
ncbi:hypothetical protein NAF17_14415 [Mucilaginibacter sp. RB4R14]|uniref:hypothetical protein n=1 Tax=Mucilaginibacter aurantiaciroseus TaxID=2949308 RepID=UPI0020905104|nr:hypothetical protein [Mucilaginibacter aurantiaciroseus]MCO5936734.1 hypothetical protein [Mucilaginibacter aurantiaciroseus]